MNFGYVISSDNWVSHLSDFVYDSKDKFLFISFNIVLQFFNGRSEYETAVTKSLYSFPDLKNDQHFNTAIELIQDLNTGHFLSYFNVLETGSFYWKSFLSVKKFLFAVRAMQYSSLKKTKFNRSIKSRKQKNEIHVKNVEY